MVPVASAETRLFDLWMEQVQSSMASSEQGGRELKRLHQQQTQVQEAHQAAVQQAQTRTQQAGWWQTAARICRVASAAVAAVQGGWKSTLAGVGLISLEVASMTGAIDKAEQAAGKISPHAATAVRVGSAAASIGLSAYIASQGIARGGWAGALQGTATVGSGIAAIGQAVVQSQARQYEAKALEHEAELRELEAAQLQLQQRLELEAQRRNQLLTQLQQTMEMWALPT